MGAWIEMASKKEQLKVDGVAPLVGAWIEIWIEMASKKEQLKVDGVAPLVGAWIEIVKTKDLYSESQSRSLRGSVD